MIRHEGLWLLNRSTFFQRLIGPLGFGGSLYHKRPVRLLLDEPTPVFSADMDVESLAEELLNDASLSASNDLLVAWDDGMVGTVNAAAVLRRIAHSHAGQARQILTSEQRFKALVQHSADAVAILDERASVMYLGPSSQLHIMNVAGSVGSQAFPSIHPGDASALQDLVSRCLANPGVEINGEFRTQDGDLSWRWLELNGRNLLNEPAVRGIVVNYRDVTEKRMMGEQLRFLAHHDPLTGLPNRTVFMERLHHAVEHSRHAGSGLAVLFCDLDGFKAVNDTRGHAAGDALLRSVAGRLSAAVRGEDTVARFGGDEFVVLLDGITAEDARRLGERLVAGLRSPAVVDMSSVSTRASVGLAHTHSGSTPTEELVRRADLAMYAAKSSGKDRLVEWDDSTHERLVVLSRTALELPDALQRGELRLVYQPIVTIDTGSVVGAEALLRWRHPTRGMVSPTVFVPAAEQTGHIVEMGQWVLEEACAQFGRWRAAGAQLETISVNLSARQLEDPSLIDHLAAVLATNGLEATVLEIEITETVAIRDVSTARHVLEQLRALGCRLAIDDFGTGNASLSYLRQLPFDTLKIDRSFIEYATASDNDLSFLRGLIEFAHGLNLCVVAEGIEDLEQLEIARILRADRAQGFFFCPPVDAVAMTGLLSVGKLMPTGSTNTLSTT